MSMLEKLKEKSKGELSEEKAKALKSKIEDLKSMVGDSFSKKLGDLKKVTVASNSEEGLKEGLDMAKEKVSEEGAKHESSESKSTEKIEDIAESNLSDEEKIAELQKQIEELKSKKKNTDLASAKDSLKSVF